MRLKSCAGVPISLSCSMATTESLIDFHRLYLPSYQGAAPESFLTHAIGPNSTSVPYGHRSFYQICLFTGGQARLDYGGEIIAINCPALVLLNPLVAYAQTCLAQAPLTGFFCLFTTDFLHRPGYAASVQESALLRFDVSPVTMLTEAQGAFLSQLFQQLLAEGTSTYRYRDDLVRTYVQLLLHEAQRLRPELQSCPTSRAHHRLVAQFMQALEAQFPIASIGQPLRLHTAEALAGHLGVHINYLNRVLRQVTGRTTSSYIAARITQEAKALLLHTDWAVADISDSLRFADPTYFAHFFRKHVGVSANTFRQQAIHQLAGSVR
jgi:AraC family transcriptional activator of pobA